ncbi:hypothetical protein BW727_100497 [Jeotgalibaca dankookensis]|uniref:Uncharacterized protein n=1 Tax=Jeotgalibaca dankookensis TaxID=708126 RepID=A0A1S6IMY6_9LACT|nr:cell wall-active antibiotics response protein LiaF [Jeotgalibaca dankookensis]AQS52890.1 hypothetical protein BW727_100497 [Jeotgalibaca dankookensis]
MRKMLFKFFIAIEGMLLLLAAFQIIQQTELLLIIFIGYLLVRTGKRKKNRNKTSTWIGWFMIFFSILSTVTVWVVLGIALIYLTFSGTYLFKKINVTSFGDFPWKKKEYVGVRTAEPLNQSGRRIRQKWIGDSRIGNHVYEWNDMNLSRLIGDTIIDLGNTLLPDDQNVILIRKGIGKTRIIIPMGVGVSIQHAAVQGHLIFDNEPYSLSNEVLTLYSKNFETASRTIKIVSSAIIGDFEVIYL